MPFSSRLGVPFGARGTVVAIHDPAEGCVEVVLDEEFIGGSTLQGTCANFRGKLCVWNHLLKISMNGQGIIDSVMPSGAGRAVIENLMKDIQVVEPPPEPNAQKEQSPWGSPQRPASAPRTGSNPPAESSSRGGRQGAWHQARGPPEKVVGFTNYGRKVSNGYDAWKKLAKGGANGIGKVKIKNNAPNSKSSEVQLKAILGVDATAAFNSQPSTNDSNAAAEGLKAMLGLGVNPSSSQNVQSPPSETAAADVLMQMMMQGGSTPAVPVPMPQQVPTAGFNFTYLKEGEDPSKPEQPKMMSPYNQTMTLSVPTTKEVIGRSSASTKKQALVVPSVVMKSKK